ncbi:unnamed protein product, partial [Staurois parvus]
QQGQLRARVVGAHSGDSSGHRWLVHTAGTIQDTDGQCAQQGQFRTRVVSAHNRDSSGHEWSVHTAGTVQDTHGNQLADPQRQAAPDRDDQRSAFQGQPAISRQQQLPGPQQQTAYRDMQPRIVCRLPQQQLPGH